MNTKFRTETRNDFKKEFFHDLHSDQYFKKCIK